jgi:hypothetical protein
LFVYPFYPLAVVEVAFWYHVGPLHSDATFRPRVWRVTDYTNGFPFTGKVQPSDGANAALGAPRSSS